MIDSGGYSIGMPHDSPLYGSRDIYGCGYGSMDGDGHTAKSGFGDGGTYLACNNQQGTGRDTNDFVRAITDDGDVTFNLLAFFVVFSNLESEV